MATKKNGKKPPTPRQARLKAECERLYGKLSVASRKANLNYATLHSLVFGDPSRVVSHATVVALEAIGIDRKLIDGENE